LHGSPKKSRTFRVHSNRAADESVPLHKLCFTAPATPPACYDGSPSRPNSGAGWTDLVEDVVDGQIPTIACGSPSAAFLD
jgi:hypothetical protein